MKQRQWKSICFMAWKISVGCILSIIIAYELGLKYSATAGVITILSIQGTKVETIQTAGIRFLAFLMAVLIAKVSFGGFGYTLVGFGCFMFVFLFLCISLGWQGAMSMNAVLVTHFLAEQSMRWEVLLNETMIFAVGAGMGIFMNLHLRRDKKAMQVLVRMVDGEIKGILEYMAEQILSKSRKRHFIECFERLEKQLLQAEELAWNNHWNSITEHMFVKEMIIRRNIHTGKGTRWDIQYIQMRKAQCEILFEMYKRIGGIQVTPVQAEHISVFLKKMAADYHEENDVCQLLEELEKLFQEMRKEQLPRQREEFESRAVLFVFMLNMQEFLDIKKEFAKNIT